MMKNNEIRDDSCEIFGPKKSHTNYHTLKCIGVCYFAGWRQTKNLCIMLRYRGFLQIAVKGGGA